MPAIIWNEKLRNYDTRIAAQEPEKVFQSAKLLSETANEPKEDHKVAIQYIEEIEVSQDADFDQELQKIRLPDKFTQVDENVEDIARENAQTNKNRPLPPSEIRNSLRAWTRQYYQNSATIQDEQREAAAAEQEPEDLPNQNPDSWSKYEIIKED